MYKRQSHTNLGYTWKQFGTGLDVDTTSSGEIAWPARDTQVIENSVDDYINSDQPFHVYYLTISGHMPYNNNRIVQPYLDEVRALPYSQTTQNYMATVMEVDRALALLLEKLEEAGKLDKTLIIATGDHIPYSNAGVLEELSGRTFGSSSDLEALNESAIDFDVYKNTLILWSASMEEPVQVDKPCCQVEDVYKRQARYSSTASPRAGSPFQNPSSRILSLSCHQVSTTLSSACLLYTSRCV